MTTELSVSRADGVSAIVRYAAEIDRLNAASRRPSPFSSAAFLNCYALRNQYYRPGHGERLFLVREGGQLVGCAPMRQARERLTPAKLGPFGLFGTRLEFLAAGDTEQLQFLCAPEDEARVTEALVRHFCERELDWGMLELVGQEPEGLLHRAIHGATRQQLRARDIAVEPVNEVRLTWPDLNSYFRSLTKHMRSNVSRQARRLYAAGAVELVLARGGAEVSAWYDAYLDLDGRSWKAGTVSSLAYAPRRTRFYREIAAGHAGFEPWFIGVILDGVLIAGLLNGTNASESPASHGAWCLEMAYDQSRAELGPGQLLLLLAVGEALARRDTFLNFLNSFAYYKHRWGAQPIKVVNLQLIRPLSPHRAKAWLGDLRRDWRSYRARRQESRGAAALDSAPEAPADSPPRVVSPADWDRARGLTSAALAAAGPGLRRLDPTGARSYLPFDLE